MFVRRKRLAAMMIVASPLTFIVAARDAHAQRAGENAVTAAADVFGTAVGNESTGIYDPGDVRGFSPLRAGNVRIEGLYFDKVGDENDRLQASSRIHVGIAAQSYAFAAPTGIVDYALRMPGAAANLSIFTEGSSLGYGTLQLDGAAPLNDRLGMGGGIGYVHNVSADGTSNREGTIAVIFKWHPLPNLEISPFWSRKDTFEQKNGEAYQPVTNFLPDPMPQRHFFGPRWATSTDFSINYGSLLRYALASWVMRLGVFRSELAQPTSNLPYLNLATRDHGELAVDSSPPSHLGSTSGELRLEKNLTRGPWANRLVLSLRERNWTGRYGNAITVDVGPQTINQWINSPRPSLEFPALIHDHVDERWAGLEYQVARSNRLQVSLAAQKVHYYKRTAIPAQSPVSFATSPGLVAGAVTGNVTDQLAIFASYTEGLEDNGNAPSNAANSNEALPATSSRQTDGGVRWSIRPGVNLVATVFDLRKAYFNLDPANAYRELGAVENKGLELSLSGSLTDRLAVVAGGVFSKPAVRAAAPGLGVSGDRPVGIYSRKLVLDINWKPPGTSGLAFDLDTNYYGSVPGSLDNAVSVPAYTTVDWDTRYEFRMAERAASLKFAVMNLFNVRALRVLDSNTYGFYSGSGRRIELRLIVDVG
ncbi:MAG: TonB-dependent receptor [Proteobacteria bacterium]|nr:TonB-dependent receptor [Pseudomonadota bacterium]